MLRTHFMIHSQILVMFSIEVFLDIYSLTIIWWDIKNHAWNTNPNERKVLFVSFPPTLTTVTTKQHFTYEMAPIMFKHLFKVQHLSFGSTVCALMLHWAANYDVHERKNNHEHELNFKDLRLKYFSQSGPRQEIGTLWSLWKSPLVLFVIVIDFFNRTRFWFR
jgi:hypothetical protein